MIRPGIRLRQLAARWCGAGTMERLIDPVLADLQAEYDEAVRHGRLWRSRWILITGYVAFLKVVVWRGVEYAMTSFRHGWTQEDQRAFMRTLGFSIATIGVVTVVFLAPPFLSYAWNRPNRAELATYLIPQALPMSIPVGLILGILCGLGRVNASRRSRSLVLLLAIIFSAVSFTMLAWLLPRANHAFRILVAKQIDGAHPVMKGINELTLSELGQLLEPGTHEPMPLARASDRHRLAAVHYHTRWALSCAPLVVSLFALAVTARGRRGRLMLGFAGCGTILGYYILMVAATGLGQDRSIPAYAAAWFPNAAFLALSLALMKVGSPRSSLAARA
jgi:hypothetical protein